MACYLLYGEDEFSAREEFRRIAAALGPAEDLFTNTSTFDGASVSFGEVSMACQAMPFLGSHRLIVVEGLGKRLTGGGRGAARDDEDKGPSKEWSALAVLIDGLPPTTVLVFIDGALDARNALVKAVRGKGEVRTFASPRGAELEAWIVSRAKAKGASVDGPAVQQLAELVGGNLRLLDVELEKLAMYAGNRSIARSDVDALVAQAREVGIFDLVDAVAARQQARAMRSLDRLIVQGTPPPVAMTTLARQLRLMVQVKVLSGRGAGDGEIMAALGTRSDFVVRKTKQQSKGYTLDALKRLYERLLETDLAIKTGELTDELALEIYVAEASEPASRR